MLWCGKCEKEYPDGASACPDCGGELSKIETSPSWGFSRKGEASPLWPQDENGEPVEAAFLANVQGDQIDSEMALSLLRSFGIPYTCEFPGSGRFVKLIFGFTAAGMDIFVPTTRLEEARQLLSGGEDEGELPEELRDAEDYK